MVKDEDPANNMPVDSKEQERLELASLEKEAQKAADLAQIAPSGTSSNPAAKKKPHGRGEKIVQFYGGGKSEEKERESKIRYEEALPWHMEDAENKHTFVGNYEAALSYSQVIFIIEGSSFKMIPLEKWYKMTAKNQFKTLTIEEAEAQMSKKSQVPRWHMKAEEEEQKIKQERLGQNEIRGLFTVKKESHTSKRTAKTELQDADDLDFEGNEFQDDEEHQTVEPERDEESKETESRLKREYLTANLFGDADEYEVDKEEEQEEKVKEVSKALGKKTKKALKNREKNYLYDSDSDKDPYATDTVRASDHFRLSRLLTNDRVVTKIATKRSVRRKRRSEGRRKKRSSKQRPVRSLNPVHHLRVPIRLLADLRGL
jgi:transcription initiation factor TFIIF subunit alpha